MVPNRAKHHIFIQLSVLVLFLLNCTLEFIKIPEERCILVEVSETTFNLINILYGVAAVLTIMQNIRNVFQRSNFRLFSYLYHGSIFFRKAVSMGSVYNEKVL